MDSQHHHHTSSPPKSKTATAPPQTYKTALCRSFATDGYCPYTERCIFAHGDHELRTRKQNVDAGLRNTNQLFAVRRQSVARAKRAAAAAALGEGNAGVVGRGDDVDDNTDDANEEPREDNLSASGKYPLDVTSTHGRELTFADDTKRADGVEAHATTSLLPTRHGDQLTEEGPAATKAAVPPRDSLRHDAIAGSHATGSRPAFAQVSIVAPSELGANAPSPVVATPAGYIPAYPAPLIMHGAVGSSVFPSHQLHHHAAALGPNAFGGYGVPPPQPPPLYYYYHHQQHHHVAPPLHLPSAFSHNLHHSPQSHHHQHHAAAAALHHQNHHGSVGFPPLSLQQSPPQWNPAPYGDFAAAAAAMQQQHVLVQQHYHHHHHHLQPAAQHQPWHGGDGGAQAGGQSVPPPPVRLPSSLVSPPSRSPAIPTSTHLSQQHQQQHQASHRSS